MQDNLSIAVPPAFGFDGDHKRIALRCVGGKDCRRSLQETGQLFSIGDAGVDGLRIGVPEGADAVVRQFEARRRELSRDQLDRFTAPAVAAEGGGLLVPELQALHLLQKPGDRGQDAAEIGRAHV